jgi:hypothetical protein
MNSYQVGDDEAAVVTKVIGCPSGIVQYAIEADNRSWTTCVGSSELETR